jgi:hypothetical protein
VDDLVHLKPEATRLVAIATEWWAQQEALVGARIGVVIEAFTRSLHHGVGPAAVSPGMCEAVVTHAGSLAGARRSAGRSDVVRG